MQRFINNWGDTVAAQVLVEATTINVSPAKATLIADASSTKFYLATLMEAGADNPDEDEVEVVKITASNGGTGDLSVVRSQEGTVAKQWEIADTIDILITASGLRKVQHEYQPGFYQGGNYVWDAVDGYHVESGKAVVNSALLEWTSTITRATLSLVANTLYYIYLYDNGGTPAVEESTTAPVWDSDFDYWKKTGDNTRRCIGYFRTLVAATDISKFIVQQVGRHSDLFLHGTVQSSDGRQVLSGVASNSSWTSVDVSGIAPVNGIAVLPVVTITDAASAWEGIVGLSPIDLGAGVADSLAIQKIRLNGGAGQASYISPEWLPLTDPTAFFYRTSQITALPVPTIDIHGTRFEV